MLERSIQKSVINIMSSKGWLVNKIIQSTINGWPDLQCHRGGVTIFIEVKRPGGKATPLQRLRHEQLRAEGFKVLVIDNINMLESFL